MVTLSTTAGTEVKRLLAKKNDPNLGLRLGVKGGGCSGLSYTMDMDAKKDGDQAFESEGVKIYVDTKSFVYLTGIRLDYVDTLAGRGFQFQNPNAKRSCGCGESFTP